MYLLFKGFMTIVGLVMGVFLFYFAILAALATFVTIRDRYPWLELPIAILGGLIGIPLLLILSYSYLALLFSW